MPPERQTTQLERNAGSQSDDAQVQIEAQDLAPDDRQEIDEPPPGCAGVQMAEPWHDGEERRGERDRGAEPMSPSSALPDHLAVERLGTQLCSTSRAEGHIGTRLPLAAGADNHAKSVPRPVVP